MEEVLRLLRRRHKRFLGHFPLRDPQQRPVLLWGFALLLALAVGVVFRLIWVEDIEYKLDEAWTVKHVLAAGVTEPFPMVGMPSSIGPPNPPLAFWMTWGLSRLFCLETPLDFARAFQVTNVLALVALLAFILLSIPRSEREPWLWATALGAVNPMAVLFQRKIWPPSLGPLFTVVWLAGWWHRRQRWGALVWGLVGAMLGQIHGIGFFMAGGLFLFTLLFAREGVRWKAWFVGSVVGSLAMLPWLYVLISQHPPLRGENGPELQRLVEGKFFTHWLTEPFGIGLEYSLGREYNRFLRGPSSHRQPSYLIAVVQLTCVAVGVLIVARALWGLWLRREEMRQQLLGKGSPTSFVAMATFWGTGLLLSVCCLPFYRHYLVLLFPLPCLFAVLLALRGIPGERATRTGRQLLFMLCISQALLTTCFLRYVHHRKSRILGDYGIPYHMQEKLGVSCECNI